jgi:2-alkyl-3-oxoalkanoate reductase
VSDAEQAAQRYAALYGPGDEQILAIISGVRRGWALIPGSPDSYFSTVTQDDAAAAVVAALGVSAGVYNVVDDEPLRRRELYDSLARVLGVPSPRLLPAWPGKLAGSVGDMYTRSLRISNRKLRAANAWAPRYPSLREGWRCMVGSTRTLP